MLANWSRTNERTNLPLLDRAREGFVSTDCDVMFEIMTRTRQAGAPSSRWPSGEQFEGGKSESGENRRTENQRFLDCWRGEAWSIWNVRLIKDKVLTFFKSDWQKIVSGKLTAVERASKARKSDRARDLTTSSTALRKEGRERERERGRPQRSLLTPRPSISDGVIRHARARPARHPSSSGLASLSRISECNNALL